MNFLGVGLELRLWTPPVVMLIKFMTYIYTVIIIRSSSSLELLITSSHCIYFNLFLTKKFYFQPGEFNSGEALWSVFIHFYQFCQFTQDVPLTWPVKNIWCKYLIKYLLTFCVLSTEIYLTHILTTESKHIFHQRSEI